MHHLPLFMNIRGKTCLLVGGGDIACRKAQLLLQAGALLRVVAPDVNPALKKLVEEWGGTVFSKPYDIADLDGICLAVAATNHPETNQHVSSDCQKGNIPVNVVDNPALCSFIFPSIIDRSPITVAVSTAGQSPVLARMLRTKLEGFIPAAYGRLADISGEFRHEVKKHLPTLSSRRQFWERMLQGRFSELVFSGRESEARHYLQTALVSTDSETKGEVYLVGAGPGDPDLLTFKALRLMQQADVVVYDRLVSEPIRQLCRRDADMIHVGKERDNHTLPQEGINALLVRLAQEGKRVCRLKGGDPFIFGRGGEEIEELVEAGIPFQVVPGITAANGCSAYAGIPLTHRDYAQSVRFVTAHLKEGAPELPWQELIHENQTLVLYMGLTGLDQTCQKLIQHGMPTDMPVALISHGTTPQQQVVTGTLNDIANRIEHSGIRAPTLTIVGRVVGLRDKLNWFAGNENR